MKITLRNQRPGATLVELLLFSVFFILSSSAVLVLLFSATEQRAKQQAVSTVDQSGTQLLQTLSRRIRSAERIIDPPIGESGSLLYLQIGDSDINPTIVVASTGAFLIAEHDTVKTLSADDVNITNFVVHNTSATDENQSVNISFTVSMTGIVPQQYDYTRTFETFVILFPDDDPVGASCSCSAPVCVAGSYDWQICDDDVCSNATSTLPCL